MNLDIQVDWRALPIDEVRRRLREIPGDLRGYLTVVPESRWLKHADNLRFFIDETIDHYTEHTADLEAILDACAAGAPDLPTRRRSTTAELSDALPDPGAGTTLELVIAELLEGLPD